MKKPLIIFGIVILLVTVGLSGCENKSAEKRTQATEDFAYVLSLIDENEIFELELHNINTAIYNFNFNYKWSILMNYAYYTESIMNGMENYENEIKSEVSVFENHSKNYTQLKSEADLEQLTKSESDKMEKAEAIISDYLTDESNVNMVLESMGKYREFVDTIRYAQIIIENYTTKLNIMNSLVTADNAEAAISYVSDLVQLCQEMYNNSKKKAELGLANYNEAAINSTLVLKEAWEIYEEYLNLVIQGRDSTAKYNEYSQKYAEAMALSADENINEINNQVDEWYQNNIFAYLDLFAEYGY